MNGENARYYDYKYHLNRCSAENRPLPPEYGGGRRQCPQQQQPSTPPPQQQQQPGTNALYARTDVQKSYDLVYCECPVHGAVLYKENRPSPRSKSYDAASYRQMPEEPYPTKTYYRRPPEPAKASYYVPQTNSNPNPYQHSCPPYETETYPNVNEAYTVPDYASPADTSNNYTTKAPPKPSSRKLQTAPAPSKKQDQAYYYPEQTSARRQTDEPYYPEQPPPRKQPDQPTIRYCTEPKPTRRRTEQSNNNAYYDEPMPSQKQSDPPNYYYYGEMRYSEEFTTVSTTSVPSDLDVAPEPLDICSNKACPSKAAKAPKQGQSSKTDFPTEDLDYSDDDAQGPIDRKAKKNINDTITLTTVAVQKKSTQTSLCKLSTNSTQTNILGSQLEAQLKKSQKSSNSEPKEEPQKACSKPCRLIAVKDRKASGSDEGAPEQPNDEIVEIERRQTCNTSCSRPCSASSNRSNQHMDPKRSVVSSKTVIRVRRE